jgi:hypothetical protein
MLPGKQPTTKDEDDEEEDRRSEQSLALSPPAGMLPDLLT